MAMFFCEPGLNVLFSEPGLNALLREPGLNAAMEVGSTASKLATVANDMKDAILATTLVEVPQTLGTGVS